MKPHSMAINKSLSFVDLYRSSRPWCSSQLWARVKSICRLSKPILKSMEPPRTASLKSFATCAFPLLPGVKEESHGTDITMDWFHVVKFFTVDL